MGAQEQQESTEPIFNYQETKASVLMFDHLNAMSSSPDLDATTRK